MSKPRGHTKGQSPDSSGSWAWFALVILLLGVWVSLSNKAEQKSELSSKAKAIQPDLQRQTNQIVTGHLQSTDRLVDLKARATEIENYYLAPKINAADLDRDLNTRRDWGMRLDHEDTAGRVYKDLESESSGLDDPYFPGDRIEALIERKRWNYQYDRLQKEEYIRAFIDRASADGMDVQIDKNLRVKARPKAVKVDPLRLPLSVPSVANR